MNGENRGPTAKDPGPPGPYFAWDEGALHTGPVEFKCQFKRIGDVGDRGRSCFIALLKPAGKRQEVHYVPYLLLSLGGVLRSSG